MGIDEQLTGVKDMEVLVAGVVVEPISKSGKSFRCYEGTCPSESG